MTSSDDEEVQVVGEKSKRRSYAVDEKLKAVEFSRKKSVREAAEEFGVTERMVYNWRKQAVQLKELSKKRKNISGAGRPLKSDAFDQQVFDWVTEQRGRKLKVSRRRIISKARAFLAENPVVDDNGNALTASYGWAVKFMKRRNLVLRRRTTTCQKPPYAFVEKVVGFIRYVEELRKEEVFDEIYAADETAVALDQTSGLVVDERGAKEVCVLTTGGEKTNVSVILTACSDGTALKPYVMLPYGQRCRQKRHLEGKFKDELNLCFMDTIWMKNPVAEDYLRCTFPKPLFGNPKRLLVWDAQAAHKSDATKTVMRSLGLYSAIIPGGCTKWLQAPDVAWNAPFKAKLRACWEEWMSEPDRPLTSGGNPKAPPPEVYLGWITVAWKHLKNQREYLASSFKTCGITTALDGSEDELIHCLKPDGPMPEGLDALKQARTVHDEEYVEQLEQLQLQEEEEDAGVDYDSDASLELGPMPQLGQQPGPSSRPDNY